MIRDNMFSFIGYFLLHYKSNREKLLMKDKSSGSNRIIEPQWIHGYNEGIRSPGVSKYAWFEKLIVVTKAGTDAG